MYQEYRTVFSTAFGPDSNREPYDYQVRLANLPCESRLISVPTGLGKTAAVILAWLWNRVHLKSDQWPRRLVYCLPMRTLVEQTRDEAEKWLEAHQVLWNNDPQTHAGKVGLHILMGGEDSGEWDLHPEENAILIGTQDMLLSRALNRGYGMSRYRWPMHFGLLNNDCLWVLDETQLMGPALWTSAQLDWMRLDRFHSFKSCVTWWMSATLGTAFFDTIDRTNAKMVHPTPLCLSPEEEENLPVLGAIRNVQRYVPPKVPAKSKSKNKLSPREQLEVFAATLATAICAEHQVGSLSLIVCNRVIHAQTIREALASIVDPSVEVLLLTSRFRRQDRKETLSKIIDFETLRKDGKPHPGLILVSTQVIEAGFDISSARLWTEACPWASFLQRLGRLNRDAKLNTASPKATVFEVPQQKGDVAPYEPADVKLGIQLVDKLCKLCAAKPKSPIRKLLSELASDKTTQADIDKALQPKAEVFPRAMEVHSLFNTEPDAFGGFTDVSPWIRNADTNADASVFWRSFKPTEFNREANPGDGPPLTAEELCAVPVHRLKEYLGSSGRAWAWAPKRKVWEPLRPDDIRPGMTLMLPESVGGYDIHSGWTGQSSSKLSATPPPGPFEDGDDDDLDTQVGQWVTLSTHSTDTTKVATDIADQLDLTGSHRTSLIQGAHWHDLGKLLPKWFNALPTPAPSGDPYAKSPWLYTFDLTECKAIADILSVVQKQPKQHVIHQQQGPECLALHLRLRLDQSTRDAISTLLRHPPKLVPFRPNCRHEAASALALWHRYYRAHERAFPALAIYMVAAHHGKVRTVLGTSARMDEPNVCGIPSSQPIELQGDSLWPLDFTAAQDGASGEFSEDGSSFVMAAPGWTGLVADLLGGWEKDSPKLACGAVPVDEPHALGPFGLAYFEALLRAADGRSSRAPSAEISFPTSSEPKS